MVAIVFYRPAVIFFVFNDTATTEIYTLSLHDALPILRVSWGCHSPGRCHPLLRERDRKSTRLNSSHLGISYAVFCLKKKNKENLWLYIVFQLLKTLVYSCDIE